MLRKLIPILLALAGLALGGGAGLFLRPESKPHDTEAAGADTTETETAGAHGAGPSPDAETAHGEDPGHGGDAQAPEYVKLSNQFVVPLLKEGRVTSMVIISLSLEVTPGSSEDIYLREPKLRDAFLRVMFDHANVGGFLGAFTEGSTLEALRQALREAAISTMGKVVTDVLIVDIVRQDG